MARARSDSRLSVKELVQQQRDALYATGHQNLNMALAEATVEQIGILKARYELRSRDAVVARIVRKGLATIEPDDFVMKPCDPDTVFRRIYPIAPPELVDYVKRIQKRFHNVGCGPVSE